MTFTLPIWGRWRNMKDMSRNGWRTKHRDLHLSFDCYREFFSKLWHVTHEGREDLVSIRTTLTMSLTPFNLGENLRLLHLRDAIWAYTSLKSNTLSYWTTLWNSWIFWFAVGFLFPDGVRRSMFLLKRTQVGHALIGFELCSRPTSTSF